MGDDPYGLLGEPGYDCFPRFSVDNRLKESTRFCPRHGDYCTPDCALAFVNNDGDKWVCSEAMAAIGGRLCSVYYPEVEWK